MWGWVGHVARECEIKNLKKCLENCCRKPDRKISRGRRNVYDNIKFRRELEKFVDRTSQSSGWYTCFVLEVPGSNPGRYPSWQIFVWLGIWSSCALLWTRWLPIFLGSLFYVACIVCRVGGSLNVYGLYEKRAVRKWQR